MKSIKVLKIESPDNAQFKRLRRALDSSGMKKEGVFMVSGQKIVLEALKNQDHHWEQLVLRNDEDLALLPADLPVNIKIASMPAALFRELDTLGTDFPLLFGTLPEIQRWSENSLEPAQGLEVILPLSDPQNLGSAIRVCAAFGVKRILLTEESAHHYHPKALRAASGTTLNCKIERGPKLSRLLAAHTSSNIMIQAALDMPGDKIYEYKFPINFRLLIGEEGQGIPKEYFGQRLQIPMEKNIESLNATMALTVALTLFHKK